MAQFVNRLNARIVETLSEPGRYGDGAGLYLVVNPSGRKQWVFRYRAKGARRDMGLGAAGRGGVALAQARSLAANARARLAEGLDPLEARSAAIEVARAAQASNSVPSFGALADEVVASLEAGWRNPKHRAQWRMTLAVYCAPLRSLPVDDINTTHVVEVLKPIWLKKAETASRVRGRIEKVLDAAIARGHRQAANPARWRGHLDHLLPSRSKVKASHHAALQWERLPEFMSALKLRDGMAARALEFLILTAARSGEVREARWGELDLDAAVWTVPARRMKAGREHRVPLTPRCLELLSALPRSGQVDDFVFPGNRIGRPLSDMSLTAVLRRMRRGDVTAHGFRSTFRDWAGEATDYPRELAEAALAHVVGNAVERAYRRGDALERRRAMMSAWSDYCASTTPALAPASG